MRTTARRLLALAQFAHRKAAWLRRWGNERSARHYDALARDAEEQARRAARRPGEVVDVRV